MTDVTPGTPIGTLDQIRAGALQIALLSRIRMRECQDAMDNGEYVKAFGIARELTSRLQLLADAENYITPYAKQTILRAHEIEEGMVLANWGKVLSVEKSVHEIPGREDCTHYIFKCEHDEPDDDHEVHEDVELAVVLPD